MENFKALLAAQTDSPLSTSALGFGPGMPPLPPPLPLGGGLDTALPSRATQASTGADKSKAGRGPFYPMQELPGSTHLITHYNLEQIYNKLCGKKVKEKLCHFLPDLPGMVDLPGSQDNTASDPSLRSLLSLAVLLMQSQGPCYLVSASILARCLSSVTGVFQFHHFPFINC